MPLSIRQRFRVTLVVGVASVGLGGWLLASRYSPAMELHPMLGGRVEEKEAAFLPDWKD